MLQLRMVLMIQMRMTRQEIPEGWEEGPLGDLVNPEREGLVEGDLVGGEVDWGLGTSHSVSHSLLAILATLCQL